jgi:hypothetical protein
MELLPSGLIVSIAAYIQRFVVEKLNSNYVIRTSWILERCVVADPREPYGDARLAKQVSQSQIVI